MNVYQKLNLAREKFHAAEIKKSGHNKFAGYYYFELGDFVVPALQIFKEVGLTSVIRFEQNIATMDIVNNDKPEDRISITSPMSEAALKGCHPVQNLGAVETYIRRYLWVAALEIVEHDALDSAEPVKDAPKKDEPKAAPKTEHKAAPKAVGLNDDQKLLIKALKEFAGNMSDEKELKELWGENLPKIEAIEAADPAAHEDLKEHFRQTRTKLKEKK